jgi:hypothetical protein
VTDQEQFLAGRYIATLSTDNNDGSSHLTAVWYLYEEGGFYIPTGGTTRKAKNVSSRGRAAIMVDSRCRGELRGVAATGRASLITGDEALLLNGRIHGRYLTDEGLRHALLGQPITSSDDVTISLQPERWTGWNMGEFFGDLFGASELVHPLDG